MPKRKNKEKIYERNPNTGVIRWRYTDESPDKFGWPNYGRILNEKKHRRQRYFVHSILNGKNIEDIDNFYIQY